MEETKIDEIVEAVIRQLKAAGAVSSLPSLLENENENGQKLSVFTSNDNNSINSKNTSGQSAASLSPELTIDLPDPSNQNMRYLPRVDNAADPTALVELMKSTTARIGVGRTGPRIKTASLLLFQADHAITQDALYSDIDQSILDKYGLFTIQTNISGGKEQYLLRPDLGRQLNNNGKITIKEKCKIAPDIQLVIGDGLSSAAIEANIAQIFPVIKQGVESAGLSFGTPFHVKYCRVGVLNDIGEIIRPKVLILLIGERPGLGRAQSMSAYMAYMPKTGDNDADRDVVCNIFENGGTNPLEAGAFVVQIAQKMIKHQASGVKLKLAVG